MLWGNGFLSLISADIQLIKSSKLQLKINVKHYTYSCSVNSSVKQRVLTRPLFDCSSKVDGVQQKTGSLTNNLVHAVLLWSVVCL